MRGEEYHLVSEYHPDGRVRTQCGVLIAAAAVYGPGHLPCSGCYRARTNKLPERPLISLTHRRKRN